MVLSEHYKMKITDVIVVWLVIFCAITASSCEESSSSSETNFQDNERSYNQINICTPKPDRSDGFQACQECQRRCPSGQPKQVKDFGPCTSNSDCASNRACLHNNCLNPCDYFTCINSSDVCITEDHKIKCTSSKSPGYKFCYADSDCPDDRTCIVGNCVDLCSNTLCECDMVCKTSNHKATCNSHKVHPSIWPPVGATKKRFYIDFLTMTDWHSAYMQCLRNNSRLARIENKEENDIVVDMIIKADNGFNVEYWLGAMDLPKVGQYHWLSTGELVQGYTNWHEGQGKALDQNCLTYWQKKKDVVRWNDYYCKQLYNYVCEYYE